MQAERVAASELRRLRRDNAADAAVLASIAADIESARLRPAPLGPQWEAFLAVKLHAWYTALEAILERIARVAEGSVPTGPSWHQDLLRGMTLPLPGVRPAVLEAAHLPDLSEMLSFRHFFRHAYALALDETRLRQHADRVGRLHARVRADLDAFGAVVDTWIQKLGG